jgi:hypothetical protein
LAAGVQRHEERHSRTGTRLTDECVEELCASQPQQLNLMLEDYSNKPVPGISPVTG